MLKVELVSFSYRDKLVLKNVSFQIEKGTHLSVMGESGCGKSTLLKLIYGLYDLEQGHIFWDDKEVLGPKYHLIPGMEYMKYLAQDFDLMPYISVAENVGKYLTNFFPDAKNARIYELLELVEMTDFADVKAQYLSGGQMQRVALAKVLAREPEILLLDEPFSHIDNFRKNSLRRKIFNYLKEKQITTLVATHDKDDVLAFSDKLLIIKDGEIIGFNNLKTIYEKPTNVYVSSLFGDVNSIKGNLYFPHQIGIVSNGHLVCVQNSYFMGKHYLVEATLDSQTIYFENPTAIAVGTKITIAPL